MTTTTRLRRSARFAVFGLAAIAIAGCATEEEAAANRKAWDEEALTRKVQRDYNQAYSLCIGAVTGAFSSASAEVMRRCEEQACFVTKDEPDFTQSVACKMRAQGMSAGTAETAPQAQGEARQPGPQVAPTPTPETQHD